MRISTQNTSSTLTALLLHNAADLDTLLVRLT
ncbi:hypothetical protein F4559_000866 [Saccharothrix violaceirubra]|uniref:Uncharacterized protein n=1 Tax=Saccharothrix violaceirubra TaxID=413306 RepID=A0A7W7T027_9PSEU|nr:hypothetical protein [Saccharothrix violaceirubra]